MEIEQIIKTGFIANELEYEIAILADRKLRILAKENANFKTQRAILRGIIEDYEQKEWKDVRKIDFLKLIESEKAEAYAEKQRNFYENRKLAIKTKLKSIGLTQENLGTILGHKSKTHMSELINGLKPFTLKDLTIINQLLNINLKTLVPIFLPNEEKIRINHVLEEIVL
ncbi:transcriptional regulator [Sandaracinomonas limnophila]|nr:transcriptional regulator [Sandaracinomonas limnophila]